MPPVRFFMAPRLFMVMSNFNFHHQARLACESCFSSGECPQTDVWQDPIVLGPAASLAFGAIDDRLVKHRSSASGYCAEPMEIALRRLGKHGRVRISEPLVPLLRAASRN
jgi:hypothetical protein